MSTNSFSSDLRELLGDLVTVVRGKVADASLSTAAPKPDQSQIRTAVLAAVQGDARNAKQVVEAIALTSAGSFTPTISEIQESLANLVTAELVEVSLDGDRKKYSITKAGKEALKVEAKKAAEAPGQESKKKINLPFESQFFVNAAKLAPVMLDIAQTASESQQKAAALVLQETRHKLHSILAEK